MLEIRSIGRRGHNDGEIAKLVIHFSVLHKGHQNDASSWAARHLVYNFGLVCPINHYEWEHVVSMSCYDCIAFMVGTALRWNWQ